MYSILLIFFFCFFIGLFCFWILGHDDFVFIRKNITMESGFNLAFLLGIVGLFIARLFYVILHFDPVYTNPIAFLAFTHFPGLSLAGGVIGIIVFLIFYTRSSKIPTARLFDFFMMAFFSALPFGFFIQFLLGKREFISLAFFMPVVYLIGFIFFTNILLRLYRQGELKDGSLGILFLFFLSSSSLLFSLFDKTTDVWLFLGREDFIFILMLIVSLALLFRNEKLVSKLIKRKKHIR